MQRKILARILASIILLLSMLFMPFWVSIILALVGMAYFPFFLEAVFLLLLSDTLYGVPQAKLQNMVFVSFVVGLVCFIILELLKRKMRFRL